LSGCITYTDPESRFVTVKAGDSQEFYVEWERPFWANECISTWYVDDEWQSENNGFFDYLPNANDVGTHTIRVRVSYIETQYSSTHEDHTWIVTVKS
jgi:hypothetical protein